jgi:peptidoglycan/LPS O-acetylase OafA/YrhL
MEGEHAQTIWEAAIIPGLSGFLLCLGVVLFARRRPASRPPPWRPLDAERRRLLVRAVARLAAAGYATFLLIVLLYNDVLQHSPDGVPLAAWSGLFLLATAAPAWALLTWIEDRRSRRRARDDP